MVSCLRNFDLVYGIYLTSFARNATLLTMMKKKYVVHVVGTDAHQYRSCHSWKKRLLNHTLEKACEILFVSQQLKRVSGIEKGCVVPIPVDTKLFVPQKLETEKRDVLYYCPSPIIYRLDWILDYAKEHRDETVTVLGASFNLRHKPSNITFLDSFPYFEMPKLYAQHRKLIRMTTYDGCPKMPYEALLCGLEVFRNGKRLKEVPREMLMENTIPKLIKIMEE